MLTGGDDNIGSSPVTLYRYKLENLFDLKHIPHSVRKIYSICAVTSPHDKKSPTLKSEGII